MHKLHSLVLSLIALFWLLNTAVPSHAYDPTKVYPVKVEQVGNPMPQNNSPFWGPSKWGFDMYTTLVVKDNQDHHWGKGDVYEIFDPNSLSTKPGFPYPNITVGDLNGNGKRGYWSLNQGHIVNGIFTDQQTAEILVNPTSSTASTGTDLWFTVDQTWHAFYSLGENHTPYTLTAGC